MVTQKTGLLAEVAPEVWSVPDRQPPGATWAHPRLAGEKATLDPAEGEGRRQRAVQGARWARKRQIESLTVVFHCTHVITHTLC